MYLQRQVGKKEALNFTDLKIVAAEQMLGLQNFIFPSKRKSVHNLIYQNLYTNPHVYQLPYFYQIAGHSQYCMSASKKIQLHSSALM
jgi:hypothetical protein